MKKLNIILVSILVFGFIIAVIGTVLKLMWNDGADNLLVAALIINPISILGLIINNFSKISRAICS